jgi:hypothetical protein
MELPSMLLQQEGAALVKERFEGSRAERLEAVELPAVGPQAP